MKGKTQTDLNLPLEQARQKIQKHFDRLPECGVILGSGLAEVAQQFELQKELPYTEIPGFAKPSAEGHPGQLSLSAAPSQAFWLLGRSHFYEGKTAEEIVFPLRVLAGLGLKAILLTNAAGGLNEQLQRGDICLIQDQLNLQGKSPLDDNRGATSDRHLDCSQLYDLTLRQALQRAADKLKLPLPAGVYAAVLGPQFETPAEAQMLSRLGADMVGMSTVVEALAAKQEGLQVAGLSLITNRAGRPSSHEEVLKAATEGGQKMSRLIQNFLQEQPWKSSSS